MANYNGVRVSGLVSNVHAGKGRLLGYMISHNESTNQEVTFYDNTTATGTVLAKVIVAPDQSPFFVRFEEPQSFTTGLTVHPGNCEVSVWASGR